MAQSFSSFTDILSWKIARKVTGRIYQITSNGPIAQDFGLRNQMRRSSTSIMSNIAEGFERDGNREFIQFLSVAKGSAGELRSQLYVALDAGYLDPTTFKELQEDVLRIMRLIGGLVIHLKSTDHRGSKYKP